MASDTGQERLEADHSPAAIRKRLAASRRHSYLGDAVLGGIDGCVTTFAVVAGVAGGGLSPAVVIILGFANLIADGFSMAVSNYQGTKSDRELVDKVRRSEEEHIRRVPRGEREEVRQIFAAKGFKGETLERVVDTITQDRDLWVNTMLTEEHGLQLETSDPRRAALSTFVAFFLVGLVPLLPYLLPGLAAERMFVASAVVTGIAFFLIGLAKGRFVGQAMLRGGVETLLMGGGAAVLAYGAGAGLQALFGVG